MYACADALCDVFDDATAVYHVNLLKGNKIIYSETSMGDVEVTALLWIVRGKWGSPLSHGISELA